MDFVAFLQIFVKVHNTADDTTFLWEKNRFMNRYYGMQEMFQSHADGDPDYDLPPERDPFYEPPDSPIVLGRSTMFLQSLAYMVEIDEQIPVMDIHGTDIAQLSVSMLPCSPSGREILGEYIESPDELVKKNLGIKVKILSAAGLPRRVDKSWCTYKFFNEDEVSTNKESGANPNYAHEHIFTYRPVGKEFLNYLQHGVLNITVWATQKAKGSKTHSSAANSMLTTRKPKLKTSNSTSNLANDHLPKELPKKK